MLYVVLWNNPLILYLSSVSGGSALNKVMNHSFKTWWLNIPLDMLKTKQNQRLSLEKRTSKQALCTTRKHDDHHDRFAVLNGQWGLVRAWELKGNGVRHVLQSSAVCFKSQNNSSLILNFILFPDKSHNSRFSSNWIIFFPFKRSRKRIVPENDHFIDCELKQLRNALREDIPRLKRRKWFFTCCWALHLCHD